MLNNELELLLNCIIREGGETAEVINIFKKTKYKRDLLNYIGLCTDVNLRRKLKEVEHS